MSNSHAITFGKKLKYVSGRRLSGAQIILLGFLTIILIGTLLLMLPISSKDRSFTPFITALFTSVSSTCVTGLTVVSTGTYWSLFGKTVIILLIQIGGLGFMTLSVMLSFFVRRQITPRERILVAQSLGLSESGGMIRLAKRILLATLTAEGIGAIILSSVFIKSFGNIPKGIYYGVFHSISAFCNAGFDLLDGLNGFRGNYTVGITIMVLIIVGGIGFVVIDDIVNLIIHRKRISIYSKLVLITSAVLIAGGALLVGMFEWNNPSTIGGMDIGDKIYHCLFQSITTRTCGIDLIGNNNLTDSTKLICMFLMLIGGASGSCAGGVKVGSLGVIVAAVIASAAGRDEVVLWKRHIPHETVTRAITILAVNLSSGFAGALLLSMIEKCGLIPALYETISAISTVGLSLGLTPNLSAVSQLTVAMLMYLGRVGILTLTFSLMLRRAKRNSVVDYPDVSILVG